MSPPPSSEPHVVEDIRGLVQLMSDGTVRRSADPASYPVVDADPDGGGGSGSDGDDDSGVEWKDVTWQREHDLNARLYRPRHLGAANDAQIPIVAYFHGGGAGGGFFCLGSGRWPGPHAWCLRLAAELPAVVLSFDYRLAPEHRLPAALDDAAAVMSWVRLQAAAGGDPWLAESADFGRVFVAGDSAGGNIVHHVAVRLGSGELPGLGPASVAGHVMLCPLFGGVERTASEAELPPGPFLTLPFYDQIWRLALPRGATRDHPFVNPFGPESPALGGVALPPTLVVAAGRDLLRDRVADYAARLRAMGKPVELVEFEGQHHGFFVVEPFGEAASEVVRLIRRFVYGDGSADSK